jgi:Family of unknown function (DUF6085)
MDHMVQFSDKTFTIRHPLRERLDDQLLSCEISERFADLSGPPVQPGRYRVITHGEGDWRFTPCIANLPSKWVP